MPKPDINNPATLVDPVTGLPMTQFEIDQLRHTLVGEINEKRERHRLRRANQAKGHDEPEIGDKLHVQLDSSISRRTRSGTRFERGSRVMLTVVSDENYAAAKAKSDAAPVVTVFGAERILEDHALHVFEAPASADELNDLRSELSTMGADLQSEREVNAQLRQQLAEMKARRAAPDGQKLQAAATAKGSPAGNDFGGPAKDDKEK